MAVDLPYMPSVTNVPKILDRITEAATPPKFTHEFLKSNLGFGASNDRSVIKVLKAMGFLTADGTPTAAYNDYRGSGAKAALAQGVRKAYAPLFLSDERVHEKSGTDLISIVKNTSGAGDAVSKKIATTFKAFADRGDWSGGEAPSSGQEDAASDPDNGESAPGGTQFPPPPSDPTDGVFRLHHDIHIHLPPTSDVSVYRAIFQAMKSELI